MENELTKVSVDAMGGDNAPLEIVKGAVEAVNESDKIKVFLVGKEEVLNETLKSFEYDKSRIEVVNATEEITCDDSPVAAVRTKTDSSISVALRLVKEGQADAFVSAGSTGAVLVGAQLIVGKIKGVERSPLAPLIPTRKGYALLIDCGANVDARSSHLVQFAKMGSIYMRDVFGIKNPRVAIVNVGLEEEKGNKLVKETYPLLKDCDDINFIGSIEAREIPNDFADVIVCDAFVGNVILKLYEGLGKTLIGMVKESIKSSFISKIGGLLIKKKLKMALANMSSDAYGGAPMLGLNGLVIKTHGSSKAIEVKNSILQCISFKEQNITEKFKQNLVQN
ncbi:MAG: phosphate acyltransferase PlsX [Lachnospiraceae bacterium]|nr:phosphate acyltransferase PlsX [Lachnospiraceae bacterium]